jgi:putative transposase
MLIYDPESGQSYFSKRRRRFDADRMPRELTFSCYRGFPLLHRDRSRQWFVDALQALRNSWHLDLWAWVIMPEHVHLLAAPREAGVKVGRFIGAVKERTARQALRWLDANSPNWIAKLQVRVGGRTRRRFWQPGGGYDRNVDNVDTLMNMITYIHLNPVRRGLVADPVDWEWSSARWYAGVRPVQLEMDATIDK